MPDSLILDDLVGKFNIASGIGNPTVKGVNGDLYFDRQNEILYQYFGNTWHEFRDAIGEHWLPEIESIAKLKIKNKLNRFKDL